MPACPGGLHLSQWPGSAPQPFSEFFAFLKARIATARKYAHVPWDYALFRTLFAAQRQHRLAAALAQC